MRNFLSSQTYAANIHICYRIPRLAEDPKVNAIFPCGRGRHPLAALSFHRSKDSQSPIPSDELVSVYLSDPESRRVMNWSDAELGAHGLELGRRVFRKLPSDARIFHIHKRTEAIPVHGVGRYRLAAEFQAHQAESNRPIYFCGDYLSTSTIDGAVASGLSAANAVLRRMRQDLGARLEFFLRSPFAEFFLLFFVFLVLLAALSATFPPSSGLSFFGLRSPFSDFLCPGCHPQYETCVISHHRPIRF